MDFSYLASQTFGDVRLEIELLELFRAQAQRLVRELPACDAHLQDEKAHLLKGSARAIGADRVAAAAEAYGDASAAARVPSGVLYQELAAAIQAAETAIAARLTILQTGP